MNIDEINLTLTKDARLSKYQYLADMLGNWITDNHPAGGTRLPSERALADSWGTTPVTGYSLQEPGYSGQERDIVPP